MVYDACIRLADGVKYKFLFENYTYFKLLEEL